MKDLVWLGLTIMAFLIGVYYGYWAGKIRGRRLAMQEAARRQFCHPTL